MRFWRPPRCCDRLSTSLNPSEPVHGPMPRLCHAQQACGLEEPAKTIFLRHRLAQRGRSPRRAPDAFLSTSRPLFESKSNVGYSADTDSESAAPFAMPFRDYSGFDTATLDTMRAAYDAAIAKLGITPTDPEQATWQRSSRRWQQMANAIRTYSASGRLLR